MEGTVTEIVRSLGKPVEIACSVGKPTSELMGTVAVGNDGTIKVSERSPIVGLTAGSCGKVWVASKLGKVSDNWICGRKTQRFP